MKPFRKSKCHSGRLSLSLSRGHGFTLIEVVLALVVLGGSLVVLLGLQSSLITRSLRDGNQEQAILMTRQLLAPLEAGITSPDLNQLTGSFRDVYSKLMTDVGDLPEPSPFESSFTVNYSVTPWDIAGFDPDTMRKVTVEVRWGEGSADRTVTNFFIPKP